MVNRKMSEKKKKAGIKFSSNVDVSGQFFNAVMEGDLNAVKKLTHAHGLSCHECGNKGYALLCLAVATEDVEIVKFLLQEGVNVNLETKSTNAKKETPLHLAVKLGCEEIVKLLLENNASLTTQSEKGTPLLLALEGEHEEIASMLLKYARANLKTSGKKGKALLDRVLLCNAAARDKVDQLIVSLVNRKGETSAIVDELVDHGFILSHKYVDESLLLAAMKKEHAKLIESILTITCPNDATLNLQIVCSAIKNDLKKILNLVLNSGFNGQTKAKKGCFYNKEKKWVEFLQLLYAKDANFENAVELLCFAIENDFIEICKTLVNNGVDINARNIRGETPLYLSCDKGGPNMGEIVKLLLLKGADVNMRIKPRYEANVCITAFHLAVYGGRKEAVNSFISSGVDIDLRAEDESTPLHFAIPLQRTEMIEILCKNGANVEACRGDGSTPLHLAASRGLSETAKICLKWNADIDARGPNNETPLLRVLLCSYDKSFPVVMYVGGDSGKIASVFLDNGCDINAENNDGHTAMDLIKVLDAHYKNRSIHHPHPNVPDVEDPNAFENLSRQAKEMVMLLKKHAMKLSAAGLHVNGKYFDLFGSVNHELADFKLECEAEVNRMTNTQLSPQFTLYDVLVNGKNPFFAKNKSLMRILRSYNFDSFPMYRSLITSNVKRSEFKLELMQKGQDSLDMLVKIRNKLNGDKYFVIPGELLEQIVSYLSIGELRNLILCGDALRLQLRR